MPARDTAVSESKGPKEKEKDSRALSEINAPTQSHSTLVGGFATLCDLLEVES